MWRYTKKYSWTGPRRPVIGSSRFRRHRLRIVTQLDRQSLSRQLRWRLRPLHLLRLCDRKCSMRQTIGLIGTENRKRTPGFYGFGGGWSVGWVERRQLLGFATEFHQASREDARKGWEASETQHGTRSTQPTHCRSPKSNITRRTPMLRSHCLAALSFFCQSRKDDRLQPENLSPGWDRRLSKSCQGRQKGKIWHAGRYPFFFPAALQKMFESKNCANLVPIKGNDIFRSPQIEQWGSDQTGGGYNVGQPTPSFRAEPALDPESRRRPKLLDEYRPKVKPSPIKRDPKPGGQLKSVGHRIENPTVKRPFRNRRSMR